MSWEGNEGEVGCNLFNLQVAEIPDFYLHKNSTTPPTHLNRRGFTGGALLRLMNLKNVWIQCLALCVVQRHKQQCCCQQRWPPSAHSVMLKSENSFRNTRTSRLVVDRRLDERQSEWGQKHVRDCCMCQSTDRQMSLQFFVNGPYPVAANRKIAVGPSCTHYICSFRNIMNFRSRFGPLLLSDDG